MGRRGAWPPNSFAEWMVGQNFRSQKLTPPQGQSPILKVKLSEDEVSGDETLSITYPGRRRRIGTARRAAPAPSSSSARKVRFNGDRPLKSALKKTVSPNDSSDTLVDTSDDDGTATTDESSDIDDTDTSEDDVPIRRRRSKSNKIKTALCKKEADSDSSAANDALPHPTCHCDECVKGRKILKAVIKFEAKTKATEKDSQGKGKKKGKKDKTSSTEATETTETEANDTSEVETTEAETTDDDKTPPKKGNKKQKQKQKQRSPPKENNEAMLRPAEDEKTAVNKDAFRMPTYPKEMQPNFIMPPRANVMQVEHAIESENDPTPNAFFDSKKGITRVYHGPMYGNHMGELYGNYNSKKAMVPGSGTPRMHGYPSNWNQQLQCPPWLIPGPPPPGPHGSPMPAMNSQMPQNEAVMREAASKGLGLSGMPVGPKPVMVREETQKAASQTAGSDKGSKSGAWGIANQGSGGWGAGNDNNNQAWNAGPAWDTSGGCSWSKKDGVASPANFGAFGNDDGKKFERHSNNSGSQKNGNGKHGSPAASSGRYSPPKEPAVTPFDLSGYVPPSKSLSSPQNSQSGGAAQNHEVKKSWSHSADNSEGGGGDQWGQAANNNNNGGGWGGGDNTWGTSGSNGEQKKSPNAPQPPSKSSPPSAANGAPTTGGGADWGGNQYNTWDSGNNHDNGWNAHNPGSNGSKKNTPTQGQSGFNSEQPHPWGGPPGSFPPSNHPSRAGSNAGGAGGGWGTEGWDNAGKNGNNDFSGGPSHRASPNDNGAHPWVSSYGPPDNNNNKGGWGTPPGPRSNSHGDWAGEQKGGSGTTQQGNPEGGGFAWNTQNAQKTYWQDASNQATGQGPSDSWKNPDFAQNTAGKADQW